MLDGSQTATGQNGQNPTDIGRTAATPSGTLALGM